jgi:hypothetical protein
VKSQRIKESAVVNRPVLHTTVANLARVALAVKDVRILGDGRAVDMTLTVRTRSGEQFPELYTIAGETQGLDFLSTILCACARVPGIQALCRNEVIRYRCLATRLLIPRNCVKLEVPSRRMGASEWGYGEEGV